MADKRQCQVGVSAKRVLPPGTVSRLLRLWRVHAYLDFIWMTRDLKHFLMYWFSDLVVGAASVTAMLLLAERFAGIGAWSRDQVIFMLGYATLVSGILELFFGFNVLYISRRLGRGQFDHTLLQPQPLWMSLVTEGFVPFAASASLLPGLGLMAWAVWHLPAASVAHSPHWVSVMAPGWWGLLVLNLGASVLIVLAYTFLWGSLAFWAPRAAEEINSSSLRLMSQLKPFPLDSAGPLLMVGMLSVLPVGFVAWYPCRSLLGLGDPLRGTGVACLVAALFAGLAVGIFRWGLRQYGRTGSQRYLSFGHRR